MLGLLTASTWIAGALASGPIPIRPRAPRPVVASIARAAGVGAAAFVVFLAASLVAQRVPELSGALDTILDRADAGPRWVVLGVALLNGVGEELFFRGAVHAAVGHRRVLTTTAVYVAVTLATGNLALVAAAAVMGALLGAVRQATGGVAAPIATHLTWSTLMVLLLPR